MNNAARPSLGNRAVSDIAPLSSPKPDSANKKISRGTQAMHGGARVISGKPMVLGGVAPFSPFLPLPPAPTTTELLRDYEGQVESSGDITIFDSDSDYLFPGNMADLSQRRASSDDIPHCQPLVTQQKTLKRLSAKPAPFMIRSYSMPVATQTEFDAQQRAERVRRSQHRAYHEAWSMSRDSSQTSNAESIRQPLRTLKTNDVNTTLAHDFSQPSPHQEIAKSMKKWETANVTSTFDSYSSTSSSDETDVRTPRAVSPAAANTDELGKQDQPSFFIHPEHMQKPSSWNIS